MESNQNTIDTFLKQLCKADKPDYDNKPSNDDENIIHKFFTITNYNIINDNLNKKNFNDNVKKMDTILNILYKYAELYHNYIHNNKPNVNYILSGDDTENFLFKILLNHFILYYNYIFKDNILLY